MEAPKNMGEAVATTVAPVAEGAPTITITPDVGAATVTEKPVPEETPTISDMAVTEATTETAEMSIMEMASVIIDVLAGLMMAIDILGAAVVVCFFICLGTFYKTKNEEGRNFVTFLFSSWASFRREVARRGSGADFNSLLTTFIVHLGEGGYSSKRNPKAGKGQELLLPKGRRDAINKIKELRKIRISGLEEEIALQGTSARYCFCTAKTQFDAGEDQWDTLGKIIEKEKAALFINDHHLDGIYLVEIVFSDDGSKAKSMAVPYNPREVEDAKEWFRWRLSPLFAFSLLVVHWALLGAVLAAAYFLHKKTAEPEKQSEKSLDPEELKERIDEYRKLRKEQESF